MVYNTNMTDSGPVTLNRFSGDYRFSVELRQRDFSLAVFRKGQHSTEGEILWKGIEEPLLLVTPGNRKFSVQGKGEVDILSVAGSLADDLLLSSYGPRISGLIQSVRDGVNTAYYLSPRDLTGLERQLMPIGEELDYRETDWEQVVQLHLIELFMALRRLTPLTERERERYRGSSLVWTMGEMAEYLEQHYDQTFTLDELAARCALNSSYFSRAFKEYAGIPLFEYINRLRIKRACQLLRDTERTVLDIALTVGYNNVSFFNRYFRRLTQLSPGAYRKQIRESG